MSGHRQEHCPACGRDNQCNIARTGSGAVQCWCMDSAMLPGVPSGAAAPGAACFCRDCLTNEKAPAFARASSSISR